MSSSPVITTFVGTDFGLFTRFCEPSFSNNLLHQSSFSLFRLSPATADTSYSPLFFKMKSFQLLLVALFLACAAAFAPASTTKSRPAFALAMSKVEPPVADKNVAALAAFATAMAPLAAQATEVDDATAIAWGAGLVACVVSLAVGFAIGYGTLVKP
jgi:hypothetical protein